MIKIYQRTIRHKKLKTVDKPDKGSWIFVVDPTQEEFEYLQKRFKINPDVFEDWQDENELPHIDKEIKEDYIYIITRLPVIKAQRLIGSNLLLIITKSYIITVVNKGTGFFDSFLNEQRKFYTTQKTNFVLQILSSVINKYDRYIKQLVKDIKAKRINLYKLQNKDIVHLVQYEEILNDFISSFVPLINVLQKVLTGKYLTIFKQDKDLIDDLLIDSEQTLQLGKTSIKSITNIREAYSTILSNNLNKVMKFLTAITIIFMIPNIIAGFYGMNVKLPLADNVFAFYYLIGISLIFVIFISILFYRKKWM